MMSMNRISSILRGAAVALAVTAFGTAAIAQDQAQQPKKPITPTTMKTFAGWDVRCYPVQTPAPCDMWEAIAFKKGGQLAVSVSIVYVPSRSEHLIQFVVPLGIDLAKGAKVVTDGYTSEAWHYHHCDRIGCYVIVPQGNPVVDALKGQSKMKVEVVQFHGKAIDLDVPLKGFNDAHNALVELARQKTAGNSAAAPAQDEPAPANP